MEIRWLLLTRGSRLRDSGALDIREIFDKYRTNGPPYTVQLILVAKIEFDVALAGSTVDMTLRIGGPTYEDETIIDYQYPSLDDWLAGWTTFLRMPIKLEVDSPGEYIIEFSEGGKHLASEGFKLFDIEEDSDAEFQSQER